MAGRGVPILRTAERHQRRIRQGPLPHRLRGGGVSLAGFHLVPVRETRGLHPNHPRAPERRMGCAQRRYAMSGRTSWGVQFTEPFDPMAYQAKLILRAALLDLREDA